MQDFEHLLSSTAIDWVGAIDFDDKVEVLAAFTGAGRRVGRATIAVPERGTWGMDELARVAILLRAYPRVVPADLWAHGDSRERQAVLKSLSWLPEAHQFETIALEGCRSNVLTVFEAISCENPYPLAYFEEPAWNQMVLKAVFCGVALSRIDGLEERTNSDLVRMATDFAAERRAAGRPVTDDLALLMKGDSA
jgi:hypothetical protein